VVQRSEAEVKATGRAGGVALPGPAQRERGTTNAQLGSVCHGWAQCGGGRETAARAVAPGAR